MARYIGPVCKLCRREGMKLFLKGERCYTEKCSYTRRPYPAGPARAGSHQAVASTRSASARSRRCAASTASSSASSATYYFDATRRKGRTGEEMLGLLESRLDNVVHRLGFAFTRVAGAPARQARPRARQRQAREHPELRAPSGRQGRDPREEPRRSRTIVASLAQVEKRPQLSWLELDKNELRRRRSRARPCATSSTSRQIREQLRRRVLLTLILMQRRSITGRRRKRPESGFEGRVGIAA